MRTTRRQSPASTAAKRKRSNSRLVSVLGAAIFLSAVCAQGCVRSGTPEARKEAMTEYKIGLKALKLGEAREAQRPMKKAAEADSSFELAHAAEGFLIHWGLDTPELSLSNYQKALKVYPDYHAARVNLAAAMMEIRRYWRDDWKEEVAKYWKEAAELNEAVLAAGASPGSSAKAPSSEVLQTAEINLALCLYRQGNESGAKEHLNAVLAKNPDNCRVHAALGVMAGKAGDHAGALAEFERYAALCPDKPDAFFRRAIAHWKLGDTKAAAADFSHCAAFVSREPQKLVGTPMEERPHPHPLWSAKDWSMAFSTCKTSLENVQELYPYSNPRPPEYDAELPYLGLTAKALGLLDVDDDDGSAVSEGTEGVSEKSAATSSVPSKSSETLAPQSDSAAESQAAPESSEGEGQAEKAPESVNP